VALAAIALWGIIVVMGLRAPVSIAAIAIGRDLGPRGIELSGHFSENFLRQGFYR
jgi:hypothetical protein